MYLTRFQINAKRAGAYRLLGSPQGMHAAVLAGFADPRPDDRGRVLWRVDQRQHQTLLYLVSPAKPDLSHLVEQIGWPTTETWQTRDYDELLARVQQGQRWGFRLTANPTRSIRPAGLESVRGKVSAHVTVEQQTEWLLSKAEANGFVIPRSSNSAEWDPEQKEVAVSNRRTLKFKRQGSEVTIATATYDGVLEVVDKEAFLHSLTHGIGRAKGYGCGLLTIAPVDQLPGQTK